MSYHGDTYVCVTYAEVLSLEMTKGQGCLQLASYHIQASEELFSLAVAYRYIENKNKKNSQLHSILLQPQLHCLA